MNLASAPAGPANPADRLRADPYDLPALAERMLASTAAGEFAAAQDDLALLRRLRGALGCGQLLEQVMVQGGPGLAQRGRCFYLGGQPPSETFASDLAAAVAAAAKLLEEPTPVILVSCTDHLRGLHVTHREFAGFSVVSISTRSTRFPDRLRSTLFHEAAHCYLRSGSRLLDEGFALFFTERHAGPGSVRPLRKSESPGPALRSLLSAAGSEGLMFEEAGAEPSQLDSIRRRGGALVAAVFERGGAAGLKELFARIEGAAKPERIAALVEDALGASLEEVEAPAAGRPHPAGPPLDFRGVIASAWVRQDRGALARASASLEANPARSAEILDGLLSLRIADAGIALSSGSAPAADLFTTLDSLLVEAATRGLEQARLWTLRGHRAMVAARVFHSNIVKVAMASQQALHWYTKALRARPNDAEVLVHFGILECNIPEKYGGGKARGFDYFRRAAGDPLWGVFAARLLESHGVPSAAAGGAPAPDPALAASVPALESKSLCLRLSESFELRPSDLAIRQGERVAIVGHNGSGKSTLVEVILGLRVPDSGSISLLGADVARMRRNPELRRSIGALLQHVQFPGRIRVRELIGFHRSIYGRQEPAAKRALGLDELEAREYGTLSRGQRQRVQLFLCLAHRPKLAVLDEPSLGLDEWFARSLREYWAGPEMTGSTVVIVSHVSADLAAVDRLVCLERGRVADQGSLGDLIRRRVGLFHGRILQPISEAAQGELAALRGLARQVREGNGNISLYGNEAFAGGFREFIARWTIAGFSLEPSRAEDFLADLCRAET